MPAQPTTGLAHRLVGDPNSAIGSLIKRGFTGISPASKKPLTLDAVPASEPQPEISTSDSLDVLERVIDEVEEALPQQKPAEKPIEQTAPQPTPQPADLTGEGMMSQVMPQVMAQTANSLDPSLTAPSSSRKEAAESVGMDQIAVEAARSLQQVEQERAPEIPPEVESYLQQVEEHKDTAPKEVVIADGSQTTPLDHPYPAQPVVVLPITPEEEKLGAKKSPKFSIRWLVEWSQRLMKMFVGKIIYRPTESTA